jgi:hypothetical protein
MENKKLQELSTEDLQKQEKSLKMLTALLTTALLIVFITALYTTIQKGFTTLLIIPIALLPIAILNYNNLTAIKKELNERKK